MISKVEPFHFKWPEVDFNDAFGVPPSYPKNIPVPSYVAAPIAIDGFAFELPKSEFKAITGLPALEPMFIVLFA